MAINPFNEDDEPDGFDDDGEHVSAGALDAESANSTTLGNDYATYVTPEIASELFVTTRNQAAAKFIESRLIDLSSRGFSDDHDSPRFSTQYALLKRVSQFPLAIYPDYAIPSRLLMWPSMRWDHVYDVVQIIESLKHVKGKLRGQYIKLEPFQVLILLCFLGPEDPVTKLRLVREGLLTISRKNAKTTLIAGIILAYMILAEESYGFVGDELYVGASDRKQAGITFGIVSKFIMQDRDLGIASLFKIVPSSKHMTHTQTLTTFEVLSSDAFRSHGLNPRIVVFDETGNVPASVAEEFIDVLTSGDGAQDEPLTLLMSTQAASDVHVFSQSVDRCKRINAGEEIALDDDADDDTGGVYNGLDIAGFVFDTPEQLGGKALDPHDENFWYLSNPLITSTPLLASMRRASRNARAMPGKEAKFRNLRLNQRANPYNPLVSKTAWIKCGGALEYESLYGRRCYLALDLSGVKDLTCLSATFDPDEDGTIPVIPYFFLPGEGLKERQDADKVPYIMWAEQGFLDITSDRTIDHDIVAGQVEACLQDFDVQGIGCDRWRLEDTKAALRKRGLGAVADDPEFMFAIGQGFKDSSPCVDVFERVIAKEQLRHGDHPVLTWCVSNTVTESDPAGNRKFSKVKSYGRIDGAVATAMSLRVRELLTHGEAEEKSAFETNQCLM